MFYLVYASQTHAFQEYLQNMKTWRNVYLDRLRDYIHIFIHLYLYIYVCMFIYSSIYTYILLRKLYVFYNIHNERKIAPGWFLF